MERVSRRIYRKSIDALRSDAMTNLLALLIAAVGVAAVVAGGADDSPGLQALGVAAVVGAVVVAVRGRRARARRRTSPTTPS
jgi:hypothetical protein